MEDSVVRSTETEGSSTPLNDPWQDEIERGARFTFGRNWSRFLRQFNATRLASAEQSLLDRLGCDSLKEKRFLDVGCGSGLFSLAAWRLGARVVSFDYDPQAVACAQFLREKVHADEQSWTILRGSALDADFLAGLGCFDIVYAWGVLHHTGDQWRALNHVMQITASGGILFVALYNDQGWISQYWAIVKQLYNQVWFMRPVLLAIYAPLYVGLRGAARALRGPSRQERGMSLWYDLIDWLGGWPFEVAAPEQVLTHVQAQGFQPLRVITVGRRHGCNEFVLERR